MADVIKTTSEVQYAFSLYDAENNVTATRTLTMPAVPRDNEQFPTLVAGALSFVDWAMSSASTLIQPANWRDDDDTAPPYVTTGIGVNFRTITDITLDTSGGE